LGSGAAVTVSAGLAATLGGLDISGGGRFDVGTGRVTVISGSVAAIRLALAAGRGVGGWSSGVGIGSSAVAAAVASGAPRAVGWLDNGDGSLTFAYAAPGDTNLDGTVDTLDVANFFASGRYDDGGPAAAWVDGDFNVDGAFDILDITEFGATGLYDAGPYAVAGQAGLIAAVPEPASGCLGAVALAACAALRERRRRG
jgi:hypothetical protein